MNYDAAIEAHIEQQYAQYLERPWNGNTSREYFLSVDYNGESSPFDIAREVGTRVAKAMGELVSFGIFDNCREHGITVSSAGGWTFCVYEHRNSDDITIEGCPTTDVTPYDPYGGEDKYDTLFQTRWKDYDGAADALIAMLKASVDLDVGTRQALKVHAQTAILA